MLKTSGAPTPDMRRSNPRSLAAAVETRRNRRGVNLGVNILEVQFSGAVSSDDDGPKYQN